VTDTNIEVLTSKTIGGLRVGNPGETAWINLLVYGEPGVGKTRLAGSSSLVPEMCPVLLLDFEGGTLSLAGDMRDIDVVRPTSPEEIGNVYEVLFDDNPYRTVIVDSLSELQKFLMKSLMRDVVRKDPERDADIAGLREWGKNSEQVRTFVRAFRDLPCNVVFTALAEESKDEHSGITKTRPALPGKLKSEVAGYVDIVLYMYSKTFTVQDSKERETKTLVLAHGQERQMAKDRTFTLPEVMEAPTMTTINGYRKAQKDAPQPQ
jgi:hypothetical protein